jgi:Flp pilus assembly protein TadD
MISPSQLRGYYVAALLLVSSGFISPMALGQELLVSVRDRYGEPLSEQAVVTVSEPGRGQVAVANTGNLPTAVSTAVFQLNPGEYDVEVDAVGYDRGSEHVNLGRERSNMVAYVYLIPAGSSKPAAVANGVVFAPKVQHELDKSLAALRQNKYEEARKHLEKAQKMAPSSPEILYLIGIVDYAAKDVPAARKQFEALLATYPTHERSLIMLGQIQFEAKEYKDASVTLQRAVEQGSNNWRAHYLLALACVRTGELSKADSEATRTADLNQEKAPSMRLLSAKILLVQGKDSEAQRAFESYLREYPKDRGVSEARRYLEELEETRKSVATPTGATVALRDSPPVPETESPATVAAKLESKWAPPDVDAEIPATARGVACSVDEVLKKTQQRVLKRLGDLEKFSATEKVEQQVLDPHGVWSKPISRDFDYLIFVHHTQKLPYYFVEDRNGEDAPGSFPSSITTRGLLTLGFMIIHPIFSKDFEFNCEGLGTIDGNPAWQLHFVQRKGIPSRISSYSYKGATYQIPLKGRMWVGANNYNIMSLETTLREPIAGLRLNREQITVDYGPVHFQSSPTSLWLPGHGEVYFELMGRRYHQKHTLTNYLMFDVDTRNKTSAPPEPNDN